MNAICRAFMAAIALLPGVCNGQLTWGFEDAGSLPGGWAGGSGADGYWSLAASQLPVGTGNVLRAVLNSPAASTEFGDERGASGGPEINIDTFTPEFRFQNLASAVLNLAFDINATDGENFLDALQVALVDRNLQPVADDLWQYQDRFGAAYLPPIDIDDPAEGNYRPTPAQHTDGVTVYRIRLRVYDGDTFLTSLSAAEVDNLILTSAFLNVDYNRNGTVDAADYVVWRKTFGSSNLGADGDGDGTIDGDDYAKWRTEFGVSAVGAAGAGFTDVPSGSVPEPGWMEVLPIILIGLALDRRSIQWFLRRESPLQGRLDWGYRDR